MISLATPLILTMSSFMLMNFVDAMMLSWYSADAIAAVVPASMGVYLLMTLFSGIAGYTAVLVAQYVGAGKPGRVAPIVWQGVYVALASGLFVALLSFTGRPVFNWVGHAPAVRDAEVTYFTIMCWGSVTALVTTAVSGFFSGRRVTMPILFAQLSAFAVNATLDWMLIFGYWGAPEMGVAGAAWATVAGQTVSMVILVSVFLDSKNREAFGTWVRRGFDRLLAYRLVVFGVPNGSRYVVEVLAWTAFLFIVGRLGSVELAATNIAWRINGLAFFPVIGLSQAVGILVGNAQGEKRSDVSVLVTKRGLALSQVWMMTMALGFVLFPGLLYGLFEGDAESAAADFAAIAAMGAVLLRFVALYSLLDGFNMVVLSTLQSAGDTRWTFVVSLILHTVFLGALVAADVWWRGLIVEWVIATAFVMFQAFVWFARFLSGKWRTIEVVEH